MPQPCYLIDSLCTEETDIDDYFKDETNKIGPPKAYPSINNKACYAHSVTFHMLNECCDIMTVKSQ